MTAHLPPAKEGRSTSGTTSWRSETNWEFLLASDGKNGPHMKAGQAGGGWGGEWGGGGRQGGGRAG